MQWNQKLKIYKHSKKIEVSVRINLFLKKIEYDDWNKMWVEMQYNGPEVITSIADLKWNMTLWHFNDPRYLHKRIDHTTTREAREDQKIYWP